MKHLGDITKISGYEIPVPDVIVGGSPCQDLSVAGKRAGLDGERSGLFMEQVRLTKELREHDRRDGRTDEFVRPRYLIWENVPGALSSGKPKGEDFRIVLEEIAKIADEDATIPGPPKGKWENGGGILGNGWSIAWRILDGQYWGCTYYSDEGIPVRYGTPQRRRRIALVADFSGHSAPEILFERESLSRHSEPGEQAREEVAGGSSECLGKPNVIAGADLYNQTVTGDVVVAITANTGSSSTHSGPSVVIGADLYNQTLTGDVSMTMRNKAADSDHIPVVITDDDINRETLL